MKPVGHRGGSNDVLRADKYLSELIPESPVRSHVI
jgi:hypothetical protein